MNAETRAETRMNQERKFGLGLKGLSFLSAFLLLVCAVQPWNLPIPFLQEDIQLRSLQGGSNAPLTEEIQEKNLAKIEPEYIAPLLPVNEGDNELIGDPRDHFLPIPYFEVPTPPPRA